MNVERELIDSLRRELAQAKNQIADLARDERLFVPGLWRCPLCNFQLSRTSINASTGSMGTTAADREDTEPCPNDATIMVRVSWQERCKELSSISVEYVERAADIEGRLGIAERYISSHRLGDYREEIDRHIAIVKDLFR
jgi:hypothetical protein